MSFLNSVSSPILLSKTKELVQKEREISLQILHHIREISIRSLHLEMGYGSLFDFVVHELKYSSGAAYRRIEAMRLLGEIPEIENKVRTGEVNLTNLVLVGSVAKELKKEKVEVSKEEKLNLALSLQNLPTREAEREVLKFKCEKSNKALSKVTRTLRIELTEDMEDKIKLLKAHSHKFSEAVTDQELFNEMLKQLINQIEMPAKEKPARKSAESLYDLSAQKGSISKYTKKVLLKKSNHQCEYIDPKSKRKCENKNFLQIDHKTPKSKQDSSEITNLQILCANHNQWKSNRLLYKNQTTFSRRIGFFEKSDKMCIV